MKEAMCTKLELKAAETTLLLEVSRVKSTVDNVSTKFNILKKEYDDRIIKLETELASIKAEGITTSTLRHEGGEDLMLRCKDVLNNGLGLRDIDIVNSKRVGVYDGKPGIVKMQLCTLNDKIKVQHSKGRLRDLERFRRVYIRSSKSHEERLLNQDTYELLKLHGKADEYTFTGSGKLMKKIRNNEHAKSDGKSKNALDPELLNVLQDIVTQHKSKADDP